MDAKKRLDWMDVSKAIGVYLVILGHLVMFNYHTFRFIFAFHMPFFFVAAGYVWKWNDNPGNYLKKCFSRYFVPYCIVLVVSAVQCFVFPTTAHNLSNESLQSLISKFYYGELTGCSYFGSAWFLLAMFWAQIMFWGMMCFHRRFNKITAVILWVLLVILAVFAKDTFSYIPWYRRLPWKLDSAMMATVFMGVGYYIGRFEWLKQKKWYASLIMVIAGGFIMWLFGCKWNVYANLAECIYGQEHNYLIAAVAGSVMMLGLGQLLCKIKLLQYAGRNTLIIFLAHESIYVLVIYLVNMLFHQSLAGQSMPLNGWSIGVSLATFGLAILLVYVIEKIKKLSKKVFAKSH